MQARPGVPLTLSGGMLQRAGPWFTRSRHTRHPARPSAIVGVRAEMTDTVSDIRVFPRKCQRDADSPTGLPSENPSNFANLRMHGQCVWCVNAKEPSGLPTKQ